MIYYDYYLLTKYKQDLFVRNKVSFSANALPSPNISQACAFKRREGTAITMHCRSLSPPLIYINYILRIVWYSAHFQLHEGLAEEVSLVRKTLRHFVKKNCEARFEIMRLLIV